MNMYRKSKGNAGLDGVQFQVSLLTVVLLNAYRKLKKWKLSSENEDAAKFDDLILELSDTSAILLQAKFKSRKKINKEQLLSNNSKTADFSLAKYFFSYQEIKEKFNVKNIIICTNTDVNEKALESVLVRCCIDQDSMLYYGNDNCPVFTFNENILPDLKTNAEVYLKNNLQYKGINESIITEENLKEFLKHLQLIFSYPSGEHLLKIIGQLLSRLDDSNLIAKICSHKVYKKVEDWFKQSRGEYFTEICVKAMLFEIKSYEYIESLRDNNISFEQNNLNFTDLKRIYHITSEGGHLLQVLKVDHALQKCKSKNLYIKIDDSIELLEQVINVFELPCYTHLTVIWAKINETSLIGCLSIKLKEILEKYQYKKVILVAPSDNKLPENIGLDRNYFDVIQESVTFEDLSRGAKEIILSTRNILFQGRRINLAQLLPTQTTQDYGTIIDSEMLEQFLRREEIKVGTPISDLDEHVHRYYIPRTFKRTLKKSLEENWNKEGGEDSEQSIEVYQNGNCKIAERKEELIPENSIYNVKDKLILIADSAGMGKSTILTKLATTVKKHNSHLWVIKVELNDHTRILRDSIRNGITTINITELLASRDITKLTNRLEKYVFTVNKKIVLMLDGIDEISPDYTQLIVSLLQQCLKESNFAKIFITSRSHMVKELKKVLKVKPFILQPFTKQNSWIFLQVIGPII